MKRLLLLLPLWAAACGADGHDGGVAGVPVRIDPVVVNSDDSFTVVPIGVVSDGRRDYDWSCSAGQANLVIAGISGGSLRLVVRDDAGTVVHDNTYRGGLMGAIDAVTAPGGAPGTWTLELTFESILAIGALTLEADTQDLDDEITIAGSYALDTTFTYRAGWPAGSVHVDDVSAISLGVVRIRIWDGDGVLVLDRTNLAIFVGLYSGDSHAGAAGTWTVELEVDAVATAGAITLSMP